MPIPLERAATPAETPRFVDQILFIPGPADELPGSNAMDCLRDLLLFCHLLQVNIFNSNLYSCKKPKQEYQLVLVLH